MMRRAAAITEILPPRRRFLPAVFRGGLIPVVLAIIALPNMRVAAGDDWRLAAERGQAALKRQFWQPGQRVFRSHAVYSSDSGKPLNYWWQAHALDLMGDAVRRKSTVWSPGDMAALCAGIIKHNGGRWTNDFFDDEGWMACALIDAELATGDRSYRSAAQLLWNEIDGAWNDDCGGGIPWRKSQRKYKNAPANGPAILAGALLHQFDAHSDSLAQAIRIHDWLARTLRDPATGLIWDGINRKGSGGIDKAWLFTYNQGIFIGACLELQRATGDKKYLDEAERTAGAALDVFFDTETCLCHEKGGGDGGLFKGILARHLATLAFASPRLSERIRVVLESNGRPLAQALADQELHGGPVSPVGWGKTSSELSANLSGVMLLEALCRLDKLTIDSSSK